MPNRAAGRVALCIAGTLAVTALTRAAAPSGPCTVQSGPAPLQDLAEASSVAISRRHPGILWTHNDSGNAAVLYAINAKDGTERARVHLRIKMHDWEDTSAARCGDTDCLYLADIGDNKLSREEPKLYRLPEPALDAASVSTFETFNVKYPDGPHNAEGMFVVGDEVFVVTKDSTGAVYRGAVPTDRKRIKTARVGELGLVKVTDAETSTDGMSVIVRTAHEARLYRTADILENRFTPYATIRLDEFREKQGEGIAMDGQTVYLISESRTQGVNGQLLAVHCDFARP